MAKKESKHKAGDYSLSMLEFLGEDILRESIKESDIANRNIKNMKYYLRI